MGGQNRTAVLAEASPAAATALAALLAERGYAVRVRAQSGREAIRAVRELLPDLVALDAVLPGLDGVSAAEALLRAPLSVRPAVLITCVPGFPRGRLSALEDAGCAALEKPVGAAALDAALAKTDLRARSVPAATALRLERLLDRLSIPARSGRLYLQTAILYAYQDARLVGRLTRELYPLVGERCGASAQKVERDMRRAIEFAWRTGRIEEQYAIFGGTIDAQRGKPTCGEMIAQLADILRLEGC